MAIPADDPRLAPVIVQRERVSVQALERDEEGKLIFSEDVDVSTFVPLEPFQQQYNEEEAAEVLDVGISELATEGGEQDVNTTTIS